MNGFLDSLGYAGYAVAVVSAVFAYVNKDRYKTLINDIYEPGNKELREQLSTARQEIVEVRADNASKDTASQKDADRIEYLEKLNNRLPSLAKLTAAQNNVIEVLSNNHTEVMGRLADIAAEKKK